MLLAILVRLVVCAVLGPNGSDDHYQVIDYILREHALPPSAVLAQSFHPPLYHLLSLPLAAIGGARAVEVFSLVLSIANAWLLIRLVREHFEGRARLHATLLIALLPQLVLFSIIVSNDSLAMLVGTLATLAALRFMREPSATNAAWCGLIAGVALLTKGTLIGHVAVLFFVVVWSKRPRWIAMFVALAIVLGSYKFIENQRNYGTPIVHTMDLRPSWMVEQQPTITSAFSWIDINPAKLWRNPYAELAAHRWTNPHSIPLLLYATFWHPYIPVSNFRYVFEAAPMIGRLTYLFAIVPTLLILIGLRKNRLLTLILIANVAVVIAAGVKYDAWSCFQSRLFFSAFATIALAFGWGIETVLARWPRAKAAIDVTCGTLYALFGVYYAIEIFHVVATHLQ